MTGLREIGDAEIIQMLREEPDLFAFLLEVRRFRNEQLCGWLQMNFFRGGVTALNRYNTIRPMKKNR